MMMTDPTTAIRSTDARAALDAIAANSDAVSDAIRSLLISDDAFDRDNLVADLSLTRNTIDAIATLIDALDRESLTAILLDYSLCPMHAIDYAICFDDDDPACAAIRDIHPSHDT